MPYTKQEHQKASAKITRDKFGHFTSNESTDAENLKSNPQPPNQPQPQTVRIEVESKATNKSAPLFSLVIQNPFKYLMKLINKIRKENVITIKIPLFTAVVAALLIFSTIPASFGLGKHIEKSQTPIPSSPTPVIITKIDPPKPIFISRLGTIKATYQVPEIIASLPSSLSNNSNSNTNTSTNAGDPISTVKPTPTPFPSRFVLIQNNNEHELTFLVASPSISLNSFLNQRVLVTGLFDQIKNTLSIEKQTDIEFLP